MIFYRIQFLFTPEEKAQKLKEAAENAGHSNWDKIWTLLSNPAQIVDFVIQIILWGCLIAVPLFLFFYAMAKSKKALRISMYAGMIYIMIKVVMAAL